MWEKNIYKSKQWKKVGFGDIEVLLEGRYTKPREVDQYH